MSPDPCCKHDWSPKSKQKRFPDDPQDFADRHGGDYLEIAPGENDE